ncbi:hypothetical protein GF376_02910 [Candidatus Peregrinibacteria bacterium]|nr:hypothetical protein [Candidatus Peregrinibacteria bacterium]
MKYNKLVRNKIPDIIKKQNETPITHIANRTEFLKALIEKLDEECKEFIQTPNIEELADIYEVLETLMQRMGITEIELKAVKKSKQKEKGTFSQGIILDEIK